ncbi:hypothetical protein [Paraburkholderia sp. RL17-347-BIC-D]|uniref:hypothetical protein n=1 Tax=Paraburkholderia sp. RL17-347-BIC-D TaxID=3031632 RepID=UPI0038BA8B3F
MLSVHENPIQLEIVGPKMSELGQPNSVTGSFTLSMKTTNTTGNDENFPLCFTTGSGVDVVQALPASSERHRLRGVVVYPLSAGAHGRGNTGRVGFQHSFESAGKKFAPSTYALAMRSAAAWSQLWRLVGIPHRCNN